MKKYEGEFTYKKKLIALDGTTLERSEMTSNFIVNLTALGLTMGKDEMTGLRYVSLGESTAVMSYGYLATYLTRQEKEKWNEAMLNDLRFKPRESIRVYEDGSVELMERMDFSRVTELAKKGEAALAKFLKGKKLPEEWDYWYPCYENPCGVE